MPESPSSPQPDAAPDGFEGEGEALLDAAALAFELVDDYLVALDEVCKSKPGLDRSGYDAEEWVPRWQADPALLVIEGLTLASAGWSLSHLLPSARRVTGDSEGKVRLMSALRIVRVPELAAMLEAGGIVLPAALAPKGDDELPQVARGRLDAYVARVLAALQPPWSYWLHRWLRPSLERPPLDLRRVVLGRVWGRWLGRVVSGISGRMHPLAAIRAAAHGVSSAGRGSPVGRAERQWTALVAQHGGDEASAASELVQEAWMRQASPLRAAEDGRIVLDGGVLLNMLDCLVPRRTLAGAHDPRPVQDDDEALDPRSELVDAYDAAKEARWARVRDRLDSLAQKQGAAAQAAVAYEAGLGTLTQCAENYGVSRGALEHARRTWLPMALRQADVEAD